ncbi:MAG: FtsW/RodA/SpoVE family cell cycle protein [Anaerorhabdus sp.]
MTVKRKRPRTLRMPLKYDMPIHICALILGIFGLIMITSASMGLVSTTLDLVTVVAKQVVFVIAGFVMMLLIARLFSFERLKALMPGIIMGTFFLLLFALANDPVGGARAWIRFPLGSTEITIQPSEFAKIVAILVVAYWWADRKPTKKTAWEVIRVPAGIIMGFVFVIAVLQSDFGSAAVLFLISWIVTLIPRHPKLAGLQRGLVILTIVGIVFIFILMSPAGQGIIESLPLMEYQKMRILSALNPFIDQYGSGYQLINGLISFATGGLWGVGFGNSVRKYTNFPAANTDFILAIIVEELGFVFGFLLITALYGVIIYRLFKYAFKIKSEKGRVILIGTAMYFLIHFILNVGGVTGLIPLTGIPLLMISAGGSSTMASMIALGLSQAIIAQYRRGEIE